ncbi:FeoA family protein [Thiobacillus sedimenti]|uniref:FeoA family protein n=1 Tax=Thiobacillus sedimenti TaxID=3110231 RepID=A0ABZ1CQ25_9PROT|nr:FeoA family protein [Thiobacillus sp. SCUT-2]WRS40023.1 FeoA family protein [Thiobacillus sp. SCUT-2]
MSLPLDQLPDLQPCTVLRIVPPANAPEWHDWLEEIGFLPGERLMVMTRALPGGDPLMVRVGSSTFALRRVEAACVQVTVEPAPGGTGA